MKKEKHQAMIYQSEGQSIIKSLNLKNMSYDKVKQHLKKQVAEKKMPKKAATKALRSIKAEEKAAGDNKKSE